MERSESPRGNSPVPLLDPRHTEIPMFSTSVRVRRQENPKVFSQELLLQKSEQQQILTRLTIWDFRRF